MENAQIILEIIIIIIGLYLAFFKSYFSESGKQLALKEHIEELTTKVEVIKSEIDLITKTKFDLSSNERSAILDFHQKYYDYRNSILAVSPTRINEDNFASSESLFIETNIKELQFNNSGNTLGLFLNTNEFKEKRKNIGIGSLQLRHIAQNSVEDYGYQIMLLHYGKKGSPIEKHLEITEKYHPILKEISANFREKTMEKFKELVLIENEMDEYLREQLFKEIKKES